MAAPDAPETPPPPPPTGSGDPPAPPAAPLAPNCESRAAAAESRVAELESQLADLQSRLDASLKNTADADRARELQRLLVQARAIDLDAATLLAQRDLGDSATTTDLAAAVRDLRRRKPHLFRPAPQSTSMSPRPAANPGDDADDLAHVAATTGDRRALLRYLRARRR